jgi:hypothetical protein
LNECNITSPYAKSNFTIGSMVLIWLGDVARHTGSRGLQKQIVAQFNRQLKAVNFSLREKCAQNVISWSLVFKINLSLHNRRVSFVVVDIKVH